MSAKEPHLRVWPAREAYDLIAPAYDNWHWKTFWERNELPLLEEYIKRERPEVAIDLGCGTGAYCRVLEHRAVATIGVDPSQQMLALARARVRIDTQLIAARARRLPLKAKTASLVIAARSLSHESDLAQALDEVARILIPGGLFLIADIDRSHDYPLTRIPFNNSIVQIETYKRASLDVVDAAHGSGKWSTELVRDVRWQELEWLPTDSRYYHGVREGGRNVFFVVALRRY